MKVGTICSKLVITVKRSDEVNTAARRMRDAHVGYLVVVETDPSASWVRVVGVLTDRDLVVMLLARDVSPNAVSVGDVMTANPVTVLESDSVETALRKMRESGVRRLPVISQKGNELVGIISTDDILKVIAGDAQDLVATTVVERVLEGARRS